MSKKNLERLYGYEALLAHFCDVQKQSPRGISLKKSGQTIVFQFNLTGSRRNKSSRCSFSYDGIADALKKAKKVAEALKTFTSETKFWEWYDKVILEKNKIESDLLTFEQAIALVEKDFWKRPSRNKRKRDRNNPSDLNSWDVTYWHFYKHLPQEKTFNKTDILNVINRYQSGSKTYKDCVSALKKLARLAKNESSLVELNELTTTQTEYEKLQNASLDSFLEWRNDTLGVSKPLSPTANLEVRKRWLWVFSMQVVYGLRIHEVFAIQNLEKPFLTKDGVNIPALNDQQNISNVIVIGELTNIGTTTKTSYRLARPLIPPSHPNLIEKLDIKLTLLPINIPKSTNFKTLTNFHNNVARKKLVEWKAPFTQTHALRHLGNINGMSAGIGLEVRSQSLGHTSQVNDSVYKKRQHTRETLNLLLNSNKQAIDLLSAINEAKTLLLAFPDSTSVVIKLFSKIYSKDESEIVSVFN